MPLWHSPAGRGPFRRELDGEQAPGFSRARAPAGGVFCSIRAGVGWLTRHAELLLSRPINTRNANVTPAYRTVAARSHGDECRKRIPVVHTVVPGKASNRVHLYGGRVAARALDPSCRCFVRCFRRVVSKSHCGPALGGAGHRRAGESQSHTPCSSSSAGGDRATDGTETVRILGV